MKVLLRDYLASLRERAELDVILPDLLSERGFDVFSPTPGRYGSVWRRHRGCGAGLRTASCLCTSCPSSAATSPGPSGTGRQPGAAPVA